MKYGRTTRRIAIEAILLLIAGMTWGTVRMLGGASRAAGSPARWQQPPAPGAAQEIPASQIVQPEDLAKQIAGKDKPIVVCVAPKFLYDGAHVPGALFHGAASTEKGLADLKQWAAGVAKDANIVLYCGCCPITRCPNVRPALAALDEMGFTHVRVLWLPEDFHTDWIQKGYPTEKSQ